ncbi:TPA: hypothetical protein TUX96_001349 [Streptococcus equi subsp. zooepidemicus]|nr:hypothetical protein [Streptococcus equi subsp. zooepidemicus]
MLVTKVINKIRNIEPGEKNSALKYKYANELEYLVYDLFYSGIKEITAKRYQK